ncbi:hypothetical protein GCM10010433_53290 [Streptomyces pulveraceus]
MAPPFRTGDSLGTPGHSRPGAGRAWAARVLPLAGSEGGAVHRGNGVSSDRYPAYLTFEPFWLEFLASLFRWGAEVAL